MDRLTATITTDILTAPIGTPWADLPWDHESDPLGIAQPGTDECDAPSDWDAGNVCFDPYV